MAYAEQRQGVILCYCNNGVNKCPGSGTTWIFGLTANVNVNSGARTWNVTASVSFNFPNSNYITSYTVTGHNMTVNGHDYGNRGGTWYSSAGPTNYLTVTVASGTYDTNGNPSQSTVNVSASSWIGLYTNACAGTGSRRYNASASTSVSIPGIASLSRGPSLYSSNISLSNPNVYQLRTSCSGVDFGKGYSWATLTCNLSYYIDGESYSRTLGSWSSGSRHSISLDGMVSNPSKPWQVVPDGETATVTWTINTSVGSASASKSIWCQNQYEAKVIGPSTNYQTVDADLIVSPSEGKAPTKDIRRVTTL